MSKPRVSDEANLNMLEMALDGIAEGNADVYDVPSACRSGARQVRALRSSLADARAEIERLEDAVLSASLIVNSKLGVGDARCAQCGIFAGKFSEAEMLRYHRPGCLYAEIRRRKEHGNGRV